MPGDNEGRDWNYTAASQEISKAVSKAPQVRMKQRKVPTGFRWSIEPQIPTL